MKPIAVLIFSGLLLINCNNKNALNEKSELISSNKVSREIECLYNTPFKVYLDSFLSEISAVESKTDKKITCSLFFTKTDANDTIITITYGLNPITIFDSNYCIRGGFIYQDKLIAITDNKNVFKSFGKSYYNSLCLKNIDSTYSKWLIKTPYIEPELLSFRHWHLHVKKSKISQVIKQKR